MKILKEFTTRLVASIYNYIFPGELEDKFVRGPHRDHMFRTVAACYPGSCYSLPPAVATCFQVASVCSSGPLSFVPRVSATCSLSHSTFVSSILNEFLVANNRKHESFSHINLH